MFITIKNKIISLLQLLLVLIYIIFEEIIWEGVAKPIYEVIHSLKILKKIEIKLQSVSPSVILVLFVGLLSIVETFGIYAGILFVSGQVMLGLSLYLSKIPIAAFTFWLFRVTEDKLMTFAWFKWMYDKMMLGINWLKSMKVYIVTMQRLKHMKKNIKHALKKIKEKYFSTEGPFTLKIKRIYKMIKTMVKR
jgi:hypothetical protein